MAKRHLLMLGLLLGGSALASACSDAKITTIDGNEAGAKGEAGANGVGEGGEGGAAPVSTWLDPQGVVVVGPPPAKPTHLLIGATDFLAAKGEVVSITLATGARSDSTTFPDGDLLPTSSGGLGFALERMNDKVHLLDGSKVNMTFDVKDPGSDTAPVDSKAYVPLYNQSLIAILDLSEGKVSRRIDLTEFNAADDSDHSAEVAEGVYDPNSQIAYFLLQRIDLNSYDDNFNLPCSKNPGLVVGIDTRTDEVVDLNGDDAGKAIELKLVNPRSLSINSDGSALYMLADGCYEGSKKTHQGVEVVDLSDGTTTVPYEASGNDYLASMILTGGEDALIESQDAVSTTHWNKFDIAAGKLGAELSDVPDAPSFDGQVLIGVQIEGTVGKVVRYKLDTETSTVLSPQSWRGDYSSASGTALVE